MAQNFYTSRKFTTFFIWIFSFLCAVGIGTTAYFISNSFSQAREIGFEIDAENLKTEFKYEENFTIDSLKGIKCYVLMSNGKKVQIGYDNTNTGKKGYSYDMSNFKKDVPGNYEIYVYYKDYIKQTYTVTVNQGQFDDMVFNSATYTYEEGADRVLTLSQSSLAILETLEVDPIYSNNNHQDAGTYYASVKLEKKHYETKIINAILQIDKANYDMSNVVLFANEQSAKLTPDEGQDSVDVISGLKKKYSAEKVYNNANLFLKVKDKTNETLDEGHAVDNGAKLEKNKVYVSYKNNINKDAGTYNVVVSFKGNENIYANNYNSIPDIICSLEIKPFETEVNWGVTAGHDFTYNKSSHDDFITSTFVDKFGIFGEAEKEVDLEKKYTNKTTNEQNTNFINAGKYTVEAVFFEGQSSSNYVLTNKIFNIENVQEIEIKKAVHSNVKSLEYEPNYKFPLIDGGSFPEISGTYGDLNNDISEIGKIVISDQSEKLIFGVNDYDWTFIPNDEVNYERQTKTKAIKLKAIMNIFDFDASTGTLKGFKNVNDYNLHLNYEKNVTIPNYIDGVMVTKMASDFKIYNIKINVLSLPSSILEIPSKYFDPYLGKQYFDITSFCKVLYIPSKAQISVETKSTENVKNILDGNVVPAYVSDGKMTELEKGTYTTNFYDHNNIECQNPYNSTYATFYFSSNWIIDSNKDIFNVEEYVLFNKSVSSSPERKKELVEENEQFISYFTITKGQSFIIYVKDKISGNVSTMEKSFDISSDFNQYKITEDGTKVEWFTDALTNENSNFEYNIKLSLSPNDENNYNRVEFINDATISAINMPPNAEKVLESVLTTLLAPGLKSIGSFAFSDCENLQSIEIKGIKVENEEIENNVLKNLGENSFSKCSNSNLEVTLHSSFQSFALEIINYSFAETNLTVENFIFKD